MAWAVAAALAIIGVAAITIAYQCQWHVRLAREIRALPEHHGHRERV